MKISGIEAAFRAKEGKGSLWVDRNDVLYAEGEYIVRWPCKTHKEALRMVTMFRTATKYPASRQAVSEMRHSIRQERCTKPRDAELA